MVRVGTGQLVSLVTDTGYEITVETDTVLADADGGGRTLTPGLGGSGARHLARLAGREITRAEADDDGTLTVAFGDGSALTVAPHPDDEAWGLIGPRGERAVCLPGGGLAIWGPSDAG
ncbi:DUF6188 family protein [Nocardiopsis trehalosi]|uniref:DUF6188 family protein n=1 Tax=Nocardiopsis trehalosi TaxID=109329 RepID=UPI00248091D2|nr:DUF6188 family protein [Nocardiopsis trehalosi]